MEMEMLNIKMLKDKGRTVIIISGPSRERDEAAFQIVSSYMGGGQPITMTGGL